MLSPSTLYSEKFDTIKYSEAMCKPKKKKSFLKGVAMVINLGNKATGRSYCFYTLIYIYMLQEKHVPPPSSIFFSVACFSITHRRFCR